MLPCPHKRDAEGRRSSQHPVRTLEFPHRQRDARNCHAAFAAGTLSNPSIDFLVGDKTALLLEGQPLRNMHIMSRRFIYSPWRFFTLFSRRRRERFDLAVNGGMGGFSGPLFSWLSGARHRIGVDGRYNRFLTTRLHLPARSDVYDRINSVGKTIGAKVQAWPSYRVSPAVSAQAVTLLERLASPNTVKCGRCLACSWAATWKKRWPRKKLAGVDRSAQRTRSLDTGLRRAE